LAIFYLGDDHMIWRILIQIIDFSKRIYRIIHLNWIDIEIMRMVDDTFVAIASEGKFTAYHNYGSTQEQARDLALWNLKKCYENEKAPLQ
jgi:hypothetical protein